MLKFCLYLLFSIPFIGLSQSIDSTYIHQVDSLIKISRAVTDKRDFDSAIQLNTLAEKITLEKIGKETAAFGNVCSNYGRIFIFNGNYPEAEKWFLQTIEIREKVLGKEHPDYGLSLYYLASLYQRMGKNEKAELLFLIAMDIQEKVFGKEHPDYARSIFGLAFVYARMGKNERAELLYLEFNAIREKTMGKEHPDYALSLYYLGIFYGNIGQNEKAETYYIAAKEIQEKVLGKEHPDYVWTLNNLGVLYKAMGQYAKAEPLLIEAKDTRGKVKGREHPEYAASLKNLASLYMDMGQYGKAEPLLIEAKDILEKVFGKLHPEYANNLNSLGILYTTMGNFEKAESLYIEALAIQEKKVGKKDPAYSRSLNNLGICYWYMGQYEKAEKLYLEANAIDKQVSGKNASDDQNGLHNLAILYAEMGQYEKAEAIYIEVIASWEKALGKEHPLYATGLNSLGILYISMGQYEKAESLFLEAIAIRRKILGIEHEHYSQSADNLALVYWQMGQYEKAEELYLEANASFKKALGKEHPTYATNLENLGRLYYSIGNYEKADVLYLESIAIREKTLGKEHPDYARNLSSLGILYKKKGQYQKAESFLLKSISILEKAVGKGHPLMVDGLINLALLYQDMKEYKKAEPYFSAAALLYRKLILSGLRHLSEQEMNQYLLTFADREAEILFFNQVTAATTGIAQLGYDNVLFLKGFLLNAYQQSKKLILRDTTATEKYTLLQSYGRRLAKEYAKPIEERKGVAELEEKSNTLEKELAKTVAGYGEAIKQIKWQEVQQKLKKEEAAIEFVYYRYAEEKKADSTFYAAYLLKAGTAPPQFISLFEERSIDSLLQSSGGKKADYVNSLYTLADRGIKVLQAPKRSLYEILWKPLEKELAGIKTIYFSPAGLLHRINLDAIPLSETETLADRFQLIELNSTRQLVIPYKINQVNKQAVEYGGITFDDKGSDSATRGVTREETWTFLPGTEREILSLEKILQSAGVKTSVKKGLDATEESFKKLGTNNASSPWILHVATHGYFFPDPKGKDSVVVDGQEPVFKMSDHPMLRSGLILAGGNTGWNGKRTLEGKEDGVLTAYEISQMNLSNTELVVLSACETGLGTIQGNEGVFGLQRAFKIAGARYLIMSLWKVPDKQTTLLMEAFYKKWLVEKLPIPKAFHEAQKQLREAGLDPYNWAGFVLLE